MNLTLLVQTESSLGEILRIVFEEKKLKDPKFSLQYVCNKCEIPSRGHLSDVMKGRRKLKVSYINNVFTLLGFSKNEIEVIKLLSQLEKAKTIQLRESISKKIYLARKKLNIQVSQLNSGDFNPFIFVKAFCSLGIQNLEPTLELIAKSINEEIKETEKALDALLNEGFIVKENEYYLYDKNLSEVLFPEGDNEQFQIKHIKLAIQDALKRLPQEFNNKKSTYFESATVSVKLPQYQDFLSELKDLINNKLSSLESGRADDIVHFNFLIYPETKQ
jgi:uncharacterized protein (TIGR02147 family)